MTMDMIWMMMAAWMVEVSAFRLFLFTFFFLGWFYIQSAGHWWDEREHICAPNQLFTLLLLKDYISKRNCVNIKNILTLLQQFLFVSVVYIHTVLMAVVCF